MPAIDAVSIGSVTIAPLLDAPVLMNPRHFLPQHADRFYDEFGTEADERGLFTMSITCYLVRSAGWTLLIDTGLGPRRRPGFPVGRLDEALRGAGVDPGDIDLVVHTHLHIDHVGWNTVDLDGGRREVFFPKAEFVIQQTEWDYWMAPERLDERRRGRRQKVFEGSPGGREMPERPADTVTLPIHHLDAPRISAERFQRADLQHGVARYLSDERRVLRRAEEHLVSQGFAGVSGRLPR